MIYILQVLLMKHLTLHNDILYNRLEQFFVPEVLLDEARFWVVQLKKLLLSKINR